MGLQDLVFRAFGLGSGSRFRALGFRALGFRALGLRVMGCLVGFVGWLKTSKHPKS